MNKPSGRISPEENHRVFEMLGERRQSLSTAVVQLLIATQSPSRSWQLVVTGVACFVKDSVRRGYFIQVFDMDNCQRIWEQELYNEMIYKNSTDTFHTFEGDSAQIGLSFVDNREALDFKAAVMERLEKRRERIAQRKMSLGATNNASYPNHHINQTSSKVGPTPIIVHDINLEAKRDDARDRKISHAREKYFTLGRRKNKEKQKLTKLDIGTPSVESFVHVTGVRPSTQGFQMVDNTDQINPLLREFLQVAGLNESILSNPQQKEEIYKFIEDNQVLENMEYRRKTVRTPNSQKPKVAPKPSIKLQSAPSFAPPPPPIEKSYRMPSPVTQRAHDQMPSQELPLPPPSFKKLDKTNNPTKLPTQPKVSAGVPPPPPPPPPPMPTNSTRLPLSVPAAPKKAASNGKAEGNATSSLMEAIRLRGGVQGGGLKHVNDDNRNSNSNVTPPDDGSLINVLQGALCAIKTANQSDSSGDSSSEGEWSEEEC